MDVAIRLAHISLIIWCVQSIAKWPCTRTAHWAKQFWSATRVVCGMSSFLVLYQLKLTRWWCYFADSHAPLKVHWRIWAGIKNNGSLWSPIDASSAGWSRCLPNRIKCELVKFRLHKSTSWKTFGRRTTRLRSKTWNVLVLTPNQHRCCFVMKMVSHANHFRIIFIPITDLFVRRFSIPKGFRATCAFGGGIR